VPIVTFHGTDDHTNPYAGGGNVYWQYGVEAAVSRWVALDGCRPAPVVTKVAAHVERRRYMDCRDGAVVEFDRIDAPQAQGGGHTWPGSPPRGAPPDFASSDNPSREIIATERIWEFFSQFRL
jgi:polyhydroxybutyrate depolymerase